MSQVKLFLSFINTLVSNRSVSRFGAGSIGTAIILPWLYTRFVSLNPPEARPWLTAAYSIISFVLGIVVLEACLWVFKKFGKETGKSLLTAPGEKVSNSLNHQGSRSRLSHSRPTISPQGNLSARTQQRNVDRSTIKDQPRNPTSVERSQQENPVLGSRTLPSYVYLLPLLLFVFIVAPVLIVRYFSPQVSEGSIATKQNPDGTGREDNVQSGDSEAFRKAIEKKPPELAPALLKYADISNDIKQILSEGLEEKNIGGAVAVAITNSKWNGDHIYKQPEELGFQKTTNYNALVNCARRKDISIDRILLKPRYDKRFRTHVFDVTLTVTNLTPNSLRCAIPKGQIFEVKDALLPADERLARHDRAKSPQGVAKAEEGPNGGVIIIPPRTAPKMKPITFTAFCVDEDLALPNGLGNITIYELSDKSYITPAGLHKQMEDFNKA